MRRSVALTLSALACLPGLAGCSLLGPAPTPGPARPAPMELAVDGFVTGETAADGSLTLTLEDGSRVTLDTTATRRVHEGAGDPLLLVTGEDADGPWYALVGTQPGMPEGCQVLNEAGRDWGDVIEVAGIPWPKAAAFVSEAPGIGPGMPYPGGTRFCLDGSARVWLATTR